MPISDQRLVELIISGDLTCELDVPEVVLVFGRTVKAYRIGNDNRHRGDARKRWAFSMRIQGQRRTIVRAKLVWMIGARQEVPAGFEIHHLNGDNQDDRWENLVAVMADDHRKVEAWDKFRDIADSTGDEIPF